MMMFCLLIASLVATTAQGGSPDNASSRLMIHIPHSLFKEDGYDHRVALFGVPPYGGSMAQNVYYADSDLCDPNVDTRRGYPVREYEKSGDKRKPWQAPYILMVNRGGCTFIQKVRNAQQSGAAGVVIADNTCLCNDQECVRQAEGACETVEPIMADDGSGADISIPSFFMFKLDADAVKGELMQNRPVQIQMAWSLPSPDDRVEYDLWTVPSDAVSKDFLANFKPVAEALGDKAYFTPHMYIYDGIRSHCQGNDGENFCYNLCTNNGRYCATDPDNDLDSGILGADVVRESLRRLCIWNQYGAEDGIGAIWWDYVREFIDRCDLADFFANEDCVKYAYKHAKVDGALIHRCMEDSGGLEKDRPNAFLDSEIRSQAQRGVVVVPTAFVNTAAIRGALTVANVFTAVCAKFVQGTAPNICTMCSQCSDVVDCVQKKGKCSMHKGDDDSRKASVSTHTFFTSMLFVAAVFGSLGAWLSGWATHYPNRRLKDIS